MKAKWVIWIVLLVMTASAGCTLDPKEKLRSEPSFYILTPIDFPPEYEIDKEEFMGNESDGVTGFYIGMTYKRAEEPSLLLTWTNIGYVFSDPDVQEKNLADLMELIYPNSTELDPPQVGDKNFFYSRDDPTDPNGKLYVFIYEKDNNQGYVNVHAIGVSEKEIRRILNNLKMKIA